MDSKLYNDPAALEFRIQHYKAHVKKQATQIVTLEGRVVDLEGKIAYLQEALAQERQRQPTVSLVTTSQSPGELQAASSGSNEPPHGALKQGDSPFKPPPTAYRARPYTPALSHTGSADDPFVLDGEDDVITAPPVASSSSAAHEPVSSQKRKARLSPAPLPDSLSSLSVWPPFESPRKKVKVWVQIPKTVKRISEVARVSVAPKQPETAEQSGGSAVAPPDSWERSVSPMSDLTTPPVSPAPVEVTLDDENTLSSAEFGSNQRSRSFSRELSYADALDASSVPARATAEKAPRFDQVAEERPPSSHTQASGTFAVPGSHHTGNPEPIDVLDSSSARLSSPAPARGKESRGRALHKSAHPRRPPSPAPIASSSRVGPQPAENGVPRIRDRVDPLPRYQIPHVDPSLLALRVSRTELNKGHWSVPSNKLAEKSGNKASPRDFLFPTLDKNPFLPQSPGKPGLLYRANDAYKWKGDVQTVLVQRESAKHEYVGEYKLTRAPSLSAAEYRTWSPGVKNTWARAICTQAKFSDIRARVTLRDRLSRMPTSQELQSEIKAAKGINPPKTLEEKQKAREKRLKDMEKIIKAYEDGNEIIAVWNMVCVGFDAHVLNTIRNDKVAKKS
ncbi:uncharacterized protein TRAVEDRAFT_74857 [Trametes versicolor FP-101664 SS1]|uniref:uncharacterized protein n=1 Tax=Trametes versicolor (strain FP-101664) TaxID=717944 RepID=UPI0004622EBA|nr:uncharacterized protein TRAVEDRAFT_74857 [Trametes versicolor FP-101664 SS1]EIW53610.1 hypothetical protein TRAVEDRAFT_74857 [Trametes versicolor FP-101664 SS1]